MPQLAIALTFLEEYERLEKRVKAGVRKAMGQFQQLTPAELHAHKGLHLESVENSRDPRMRTVRVTDFWRGVVLAPDDGGEVFLLVNVVQHDKAYDWAAKRVYSINTATRGLESRDADAIEQITPFLEGVAETAPSRLFEGHSDTVLRDLGIDGALMPAVRTLTDTGQLDAFQMVFPEDQWEVLFHLSRGSSAEEVWRDLVSLRRPVDVAEHAGEAGISEAIANTRSRILLVSRPDELEEMLSQPFAAWRVFLHPSQRRTAYRDSYSGPAYVSGGPGTGKTVVALHRVKHLAEKLPADVAGPGPAAILLTTYTAALAAILRRQLGQLIEDGEQLARVETGTVNALARAVIVERYGRAPEILKDHQERGRWRAVAEKLGTPWTGDLLMQEYRHVVLAQDVRTLEQYRAAERRGRGRPMTAGQREQLWDAVDIFERQLDAEGASTHLRVCAEAARLLAGTPELGKRYRHVVVDEAQDLHPAQWRLLRALVPAGPDDLFATGDPHQRIYDSKVSLASLGIQVKGRSSRLRVNYRNTEEILSWSSGVVRGLEVESLAGPGADSLEGYASLLHGALPEAVGFDSEEDEFDALVEQIRRWIEAEVPAADIAVCTRFRQTGAKVLDRIKAAGIEAVPLKDGLGDDVPGVRVATLHGMKGLEFRCVAVVGADAATIPFGPAVTPADADALQHEADMAAERCLLYVASTRAREALSVSWTGAPSPFLPSAAGEW